VRRFLAASILGENSELDSAASDHYFLQLFLEANRDFDAGESDLVVGQVVDERGDSTSAAGGINAAVHRLITIWEGSMSKYRLVLALAMVVSLTVLISAGSAEAKTVKVKGSGQGTALTSAFSFDGASPALTIVSTGKDNIGGAFNAQDIHEYSFTTDSCTAPDGTAGTVPLSVQAAEVINYKSDQLYLSGTAASAGTGCVSSSTGSFGLTGATQTVIGGTGKFANASGTIIYTVVGTGLASPGIPPGKLGLFDAFQYTLSGSVTY
jgi:hypothetical protein